MAFKYYRSTLACTNMYFSLSETMNRFSRYNVPQVLVDSLIPSEATPFSIRFTWYPICSTIYPVTHTCCYSGGSVVLVVGGGGRGSVGEQAWHTNPLQLPTFTPWRAGAGSVMGDG